MIMGECTIKDGIDTTLILQGKNGLICKGCGLTFPDALSLGLHYKNS